MTTATLTPALPAVPKVRVTFPRVVASEWRKMVSLRSTWWTLGAFVVLHTGFGALFGFAARTIGGDESYPESDMPDATALAWGGYSFSQLALVIVAVLTITAEYSSGQIRGTLMAVPTRIPVLGAKAVVLVAVTLVVAVVGHALALGVGVLVAGEYGEFGLSAGETARQLAAGPLYMVGMVLFALGVAALVRNSAAAIAIVIALLVVVENTMRALPFWLAKVVKPWFPGLAGEKVFYTDADLASAREDAVASNDPGVIFTQWQGFAVLLAWAALFLVLSGILLRRRDA